MDLLGLNGADKGAAAINALKTSPEYTSLYDNGIEALTQNASATGGLRGGNTERSMAGFGADTLASVIADHLSRLGGLAGMGEGATGSVANFGQHTADAVASGYTSIGNSKMNSILGQQQAWNNMGSQISQLLSSFIPGGGGMSF